MWKSLIFASIGVIVGFSNLQGSSQVKPTFAENIAPILFRKCIACHRPSGCGPFSLISYDDVRKRASLIRSVALTRLMPPTDAASDWGKMTLQDQLTDTDVVLLQEWIDRDTPLGDAKKLPAPPNFSSDWNSKPDAVIDVRSNPVHSEGKPYWKFIRIPSESITGKRIAGFEVRPHAPQAVRQALLLALDPNDVPGEAELTTAGIGDANSVIGSWAPGYPDWRLPEGSGIAIPPAKEFFLRVHYQPTGKEENGGFQILFRFAAEHARAPKMISVGLPEFRIGPDEKVTLRASQRLETDAEIVAFYPEMRWVARQVKLTASLPNGQEKQLFFVYTWDSLWLGSYVLAPGARLPKGSVLTAEAFYDNGIHSSRNDPTLLREVRSGPKPTDELFWIHIQYVPR